MYIPEEKGLKNFAKMAGSSRLSRVQVAVWVLKDNIRAIKFYEKCGFRFDGREEELTLGTPIVEVRMIKE